MRERIVNYYWKLRRYYWKYKFVIRKAIITTVEFISSSARLPYRKARSTLYWKAYSLVTATYWKLRKGYDIGRLFVIRLFWKLKGVFDYAGGYCLGYFRHYTVIGYWRLRRLINLLNAASPGIFLKIKNITNAALHPIKKSYWFFSYQAEKRILPVFRKKTKTD